MGSQQIGGRRGGGKGTECHGSPTGTRGEEECDMGGHVGRRVEVEEGETAKRQEKEANRRKMREQQQEEQEEQQEEESRRQQDKNQGTE